ncbi:hypothetical protein DRO61_09630 [Candidatus Bathyarchaeota archaeon]|nr:MAG: hypothetical protein DRO61_09630 [Candidatus Bathyarchaeota archaeon]
MIVDIPKGIKSKVIKLDIPITNERLETLIELEDVTVFVEFFWDSHGNLVKFPSGEKREYSRTTHNASVKVVKREYTQMERDWETWQLYVNGKHIAGSVREYDYSYDFNMIDLKVIIGWG